MVGNAKKIKRNTRRISVFLTPFFTFFFLSSSTSAFIPTRPHISDLEVRVAKFSYGLQLLADYKMYELSIFLLREGLFTPFQNWAKYYIAKSYLFLEHYSEAKEHFLSIPDDFPWYDMVLHNITYISYKMGDESVCDKIFDKGYPSQGAPELYEVMAECIERKIIELKQRGKEIEAEELKEKVRDLIFLLIRNSLVPRDFLDYSAKLKKAEEISVRIFGREPRSILSEEQRENIASLFLRRGSPRRALRWTIDEYKKARAYFMLRRYRKAIKVATPLFRREKDRKKKETLLLILMLSHARKSSPDMKKFERYAELYMKLYPSERFAGNLAIKLGVEKMLKGEKTEAERLLLFASRSPHRDIKKRAKFLLKYSLGYKLKLKTEGFLKLLEDYKKGFVKVGASRDDIPLWVELGWRKISPPSEFSESLYYLRIYLGGSRVSKLPREIIRVSEITDEEKNYLMRRGFFTELINDYWISRKNNKESFDFRSVLPVYVPPPFSFEREIIKAGLKYKTPPALLFSIALSESHFNPTAISPSYAIGLVQIIPTTAREIFSEFRLPFTEEFLFEPEINAKVGAYYLSKLKKILGSWSLAVAGYNAGPGAVRRWLRKWGNLYCTKPEVFFENIPYRQTRLYTMRVLSYYYEYAKMLKEEIDLEETFRCHEEISKKDGKKPD